MRKGLLKRIEKLNKNRQQRKWWQRAVRTMAGIVVFCTTYALILPAITMGQDPACGLEEHSHTDSCYTQQPVMLLQCTAEGTLTVHNHDAFCFDAQGTLRCALPEVLEHTHEAACYGQTLVCTAEHVCGEDCVTMEQVLLCTEEVRDAHTHSEDCYEDESLICTLAEGEGHAHGEACYENRDIPCALIHTHGETCYILSDLPICGREEVAAHIHEENCYAADGTLKCTKPVVYRHAHTESCLVQTEETCLVLSCGMEEHIHTEECYPVESEEDQSGYFCGAGEHTHVETCFDETGALTCTIPEHSHSELCLVKDLDLTADVETAQQWEKAFEDLVLSGNWADDLLQIAETQLNYRESSRNVALVEAALQGYTRYGEKYGDPYGDWTALFVRFCLDYAKVEDFRTYDTAEAWVTGAKEQQIFAAPDVYIPTAGDLIFLDTDEDEYDLADHMGIVESVLTENDEVRIIAGNAQTGSVVYETYLLAEEVVLGYVRLPENPNYDKQAAQIAELNQLLASLPEAKQVRSDLQAMNNVLDKARYDAYLQSVTARLETANTFWETLADEQKALIFDFDRVAQLETVCAEAVWQQLPALETDDAVVSSLNAGSAGAQNTVKIGETAFFGFNGETRVLGNTAYGEARVKLEFVLPLEEDKAVFDMEAMTWLEEPVLTAESRTIGEKEIPCQILTGFLHLNAETLDAPVVPGSFEANAAVKLLDMNHGERLNIQIRAAMEYNTWEDSCPAHQLGEILSVQSKNILVSNEASPEEQQAAYEAFLTEYEALIAQELSEEELIEEAKLLLEKINQAELRGCLTMDAYAELAKKAATLIYGDLNAIAEPAIGTDWMLLRDSGWFEEYSYAAQQHDVVTSSAFTMRTPAMFAAAGSSDPHDQITAEGGDNISQEGAVYVEKIIEDTELENVFDITLNIVTQDIVTEVYKEPDMEVVIVLDISNTMNTSIGNETGQPSRYKAAMTAAENFLRQFAENNLGASNVGFVAFNTDAHEIFPMSPCSTTAQADALVNTMRTKTGNIINNYEDDDIKRFTNIEAGLKRAYDLLQTTTNEHQYIVFLSDGFPTTYISSGYTGYNTYDPNGTRFYDAVQKSSSGKNRPCSYGTSYSDEAAIRARKMATTLKNNGATIFSIGVDVGTQTIKKYVDQCLNTSHAVVDRRNTNYEIGSASDSNAFKNWLGHSIGSGDGYYYDSTNVTGLNNAFNSIFEAIKELNAASSHLDWVATDPLPNMGLTELDAVEFIGFYDKDGNLVEGNLSGTSGDGWNYENTASYDVKSSEIEWDLKQSRYISTTLGSVTNYECSLPYRVRLKNENSGFEEYDPHATNGNADLTYRIIDKTGDRVTVSEQRTVAFPVPSVRGYLANLSFHKLDNYGKVVVGAEFTLSHDTAACGACRGDGSTSVPLTNMVATSGQDGIVSFTDIPSGHTYTLTETKVPDGYSTNGNAYQVTVAYDALTVTVTDQNGDSLTWEEYIENITSYRLPETGGSGTSFFTFGGWLMIAAACVYFVIQIERKYRKGGVYRQN